MAGLPDLANYDAGRTIQFGEAGQKQRTLADLGQYAAKGDYNGAASAAFAGGQVDIGAALAKMGQEKHQQIVQDSASGAYAADTPEKWAAFSQQFQQAHPEVQVPPFAARQAVIAQAMSLQDQMAQRNADRSFALQQQVAGQKDIPSGFQEGANGALAPRPGGPADPAYLKAVADAKGASGFSLDGGDNINPMQAASVSDAAFMPPGSRNEAVLAQLPPAAQGIVKGLANYELDISKISSVRGNQRLMLAAAAKAYDPTFDMTQYGARAAMRKSITSGQYSQALNSANLVIQHLDAVASAAKALDNSNWQGVNAANNYLTQNVHDGGRGAALSAFKTAADAAASELAKVFKGTGASSEEEVKAWRQNLSPDASPAQIQSTISTAVGSLLKSRIDTIQSQFQAAMGHPADFSYLTPHSRQVLQDLGIDPAALDPGIQQPQPAPQQSQGGGPVNINGYQIEAIP